MRNIPIALLASLFALPAAAAEPSTPHAGELQARIERLSKVGRVLYVAAHPDDENTRLLAHLVGERDLRAAYVSLTRGGGGQNRIGPEQSELLGVIRTLELLEARKIDGAEQRFTRARDFGYSKTSAESLEVWGHERVLGDLVRVIRRFRPDVIVNRFATEGKTHGHHLASAILAREAFEAAADPERFPEQITDEGLEPWQADRMLRNVSTWRLPDDADMSPYLEVDVGGYSPLLGASWGEIAAASRSMHKSQGFGFPSERGPIQEWFEPLAGTKPTGDPFSEGLDLGWSRWDGTRKLRKLLAKAAEEFEPEAPHGVLPTLAKAREAMAALPPSPRRDAKLRDLERIMVDAAGLWLSARAETPAATRGQDLDVEVAALNRSPADVTLVALRLPDGRRVEVGDDLAEHAPLEREVGFRVPEDAPPAIPHWLEEPPSPSFYGTEDPARIGMPDWPASLRVGFEVEVGGRVLTVERDVVQAWTDRVRGELTRRVEVLPPVTATVAEDVVVFPNGRAATLHVTLRASAGAEKGRLHVEVPDGWSAAPSSHAFAFEARGDEQEVVVEVTPPEGDAPAGQVRLVVETDAGRSSRQLASLEYPHIPMRSVLQPATVKAVPLDIAGTDKAVGYVPGSGDVVAESLRQVGFDVTELDPDTLADADLSRFDAVVTGVRAFNVHPRLRFAHDTLMEFVEQGGLLLVQYNKNNRWNPMEGPLGPAPLEIGRGRVTDETAAMRALDPDDPLLNTPNELTAEDYEGWVQERGLYFAEEWDEVYRPVFEIGDPDEEPLRGSLLVTEYGEGTFIYTGLSFFRQLPAGVPGAYRLLANLVAHAD
ncbi:MAG: PIG-L family deacetylase [Myxococcota bacterium]